MDVRISWNSFIHQIESLDDQVLTDWLEKYLKGVETPPEPPPSRMERHLVIKMTYQKSKDPEFRSRIEESICTLLEPYEPFAGTERYLYYLLSLVTIIHPRKAKQSLRRLLLSRKIEGLYFETFDLNAQLIIANCKYDIDVSLKEYITGDLAEKHNFKDYALACYKGLTYRYDESAFLLIPKLAKFWSDKNFFSLFVDFFRFSVDKVGISTLVAAYTDITQGLSHGDVVYAEMFNRLLVDEMLTDRSRLSEPDYAKLLFEAHVGLGQTVPAEIVSEVLDLVTPRTMDTFMQIFRDYRTKRGYTLLDIGPEMSRKHGAALMLGDAISLPVTKPEQIDFLLMTQYVQEYGSTSFVPRRWNAT